MCESAVGKRVAFGQVCDRQSSAVDQMQESGTGKPSTVQKHELVQNVRLENPLSNYLPAELQMWTHANTNRLMRIERRNTATDAGGGMPEILLACSKSHCVACGSETRQPS